MTGVIEIGRSSLGCTGLTFGTGADVQSTARTARCYTLLDLLSPSLTLPVGEHCSHQVPAAWSCRPSNCLLLAAVPFRLPQLKSETVCQRPSSDCHHYIPSSINSSSFLTFIPSPDFFDCLTGIVTVVLVPLFNRSTDRDEILY